MALKKRRKSTHREIRWWPYDENPLSGRCTWQSSGLRSILREVHDVKKGRDLLKKIWNFGADKGYDSNSFREKIMECTTPVIPGRKNRKAQRA
jgi:hypothetical protein